VPALDRGLLDGAEFNNASSDKLLGFADVSKVCMLQSYHQSAESFEIMFNKPKYDALPAKMKAIIAGAVEASSQDMAWKSVDRYSKDYIELQKMGVKFYKTPDAILAAQCKLWDEILKKKSAENPMFKEIIASQLAFAERATKWDSDYNISQRIARNYFWGAKKAPAQAAPAKAAPAKK
jgi:TRAP-type mannitol/chloroaromatic compound transport system substrate-binding protein